MSTTTRTESETTTDSTPTLPAWQAGGAGGLAGALAFGTMMAMMTPAMLSEMIPAMYGLEGGLVGWIVHMSHGAAIGVAFAALASAGPLREYTATTGGAAVAGLVYGIAVWALLAVIVMPIWLGMPEMVPNLDVGSLVGHSLYGVLLGIVYGALT
ncbi:histidine kinase [Natronorarus salvus]|uniref:histidine kinase n=1 Tax=Natronorarus salvus TaxID=3117733 RepID=UPI002F269F04